MFCDLGALPGGYLEEEAGSTLQLVFKQSHLRLFIVLWGFRSDRWYGCI